MKILTGELKGRTILFKPNPHLRPTTDKTRKAIFDMLQGELQDKKVLDLFSGTGALGFEALSNGAAEAMFVEADAFQAREIRNNLGRLGLESRGIVRQEEVSRAIEKLGRDGAAFDFIFIDPPYEKGLAWKALDRLAAAGLVKKSGVVVVEMRASEFLPEDVEGLRRIKQKKYGDTKILIYQSVGPLLAGA